MSRDRLRGNSIYCAYIRNHSEKGDIKGLINDLKRIKSLGITTLWILPHYPIGKKNRKGALGSPYSISDYYGINPELGGINDFKELISKCHYLDLKIIIDIVFNHTSCDSSLLADKPHWFLKSSEGEYMAKVPHWNDVYDLDFEKKELWKYLIDVLTYWAELGVDGFRCDIAAIVPLAFWRMAKDTLNKSHSDLIWLAESVDKEFVSFIRHKGYLCHSDSELYSVFDIIYDYDVQSLMESYITGKGDFNTFVEERRNQEVIYPVDYLKLRYLETHDSKKRAADYISDKYKLKNWKAFSVFENGIPLIYAGEEICIKKRTELFDKNPVEWDSGDRDYFSFISKLLSIDHMNIVKNGIYTINALADDCVHLRYRYEGETLHGIFNFGEKDRNIEVEVLKGEYKNIITDNSFSIENEKLNLSEAPFIFKSIP